MKAAAHPFQLLKFTPKPVSRVPDDLQRAIDDLVYLHDDWPDYFFGAARVIALIVESRKCEAAR